MVIKGSADKRHRQSEKRRARNRMLKSSVHTAKRSFLKAAEGDNKEKAEAAFKDVVKLIDSAERKGVYHKNTAARKKSRMHKMLNGMNV